MGERLRDQGYRTAMMASNHYLDRRFGFASGFGTYGDYAGSSLPGGRRALGELREIIDDDRDGAGRPLFLVLHMLEPHLPYRMRAPIPEGFELPDVFEYEQSYAGMTSQTLRKVGPKQEKHPEALKVMHQADTRYGDDVLGEYLEMLGGDAMVLFTSDHGEAFGEHGEFLHGDDMFDETLHVPMIVRWPGGAHAGTTVETPVSLEEAAATSWPRGADPSRAWRPHPCPSRGRRKIRIACSTSSTSTRATTGWACSGAPSSASAPCPRWASTTGRGGARRGPPSSTSALTPASGPTSARRGPTMRRRSMP